MSTTVVSFLGTGQKTDPKEPRSQYRSTIYRFPLNQGNEFQYQTTLFGTALIHFLRNSGKTIDRWVVLGTSASLWSELNQVVSNQDKVIDQYIQMDDRVIMRNVDGAALQAWQTTLNHHAAPLELRLCLTGESLAPESQQQIAKALFDNIEPGNEIVLDITHGFRHQPVIASLIVSMMRWTHCIEQVSMYSGVFEARQGDVTPVLELPICQKLVDATEAAAILDVTGNYERVSSYLNLDAELAWFLENTNQLGQARNPVTQLEIPITTDIIDVQLNALLQERLLWVRQNSYAERVLQSASTAIDRGDYFRSIILTFEGILIRAGQLLFPNEDPLNYLTRQKAENSLFERLLNNDRNLLKDLQHTRNACAHGTRSDRVGVQQVLKSPTAFRNLIERAFDLFHRMPQIHKL